MDNNNSKTGVAGVKNNKFGIPSLQMGFMNGKLQNNLHNGLNIPQTTTREEQEKYKLKGIQDGKIDELIQFEKREEERAGEQKRKIVQQQQKIKETIQENGQGESPDQEFLEEGPSDNDSLQASKIKQSQQDKKKKRKKRKKNKPQAEQRNEDVLTQKDDMEQSKPGNNQNIQMNNINPKQSERFRHNIMACQDLYADSNDDSEDEGIKEYQVGGYHPVHLGEVLIDRYIIIQKLGWGQFSTVWLARDMKHENTYVALKVQKSAPSYKVAAYDEVEILDVIGKNIRNPDWLKDLSHYHKNVKNQESLGKVNGEFTSQHTQVVQLLNSFMHYGANGDHFIMVFEILGVNLLEIMKRYDYRGIPMPLVRRIAKQVLIGLDYLHRICKIIHTDLKPENTIVALNNEELGDIVKNGRIMKKRKKYEQSKKLQVDDIQLIPNFYNKKSADGQQTLLNGINTEGLTKLQKKKLKMKIKKERGKDDDKGSVEDKNSNAQTNAEQLENAQFREDNKFKSDQINSRTQATLDQINQMNENEQDLQFQRPRSHSLPNLIYKEIDDRFDESDFEDSLDAAKMQKLNKAIYVFNMERDFQYEIQEYITLRRELRKRKIKMLNGEIQPEGEEQGKNSIDQKTKELIQKQMVNVKGPLIDEDINSKICDLGNGCWTHYHFVPKIQTRQYRAPEVIMGIDYDASTDLWSFACMIFELITGDFLFNPRPGTDHKKNDDHLALFMEMLGPMPKKFAKSGNMFDHYFMQNPKNGKYYFRRIHDLRSLNLERLLIYRYFFKPNEAKIFADFLMRILKWCPGDRPTAQKMLEHEWLTMPDNYNYKMSEMEYKLFELKDQVVQLNNTDADINYLLNEKAELMNQNSTHQLQIDCNQIEALIKKKQQQSGIYLYRYPGQLADSDEELYGGDEDNISKDDIKNNKKNIISSPDDSESVGSLSDNSNIGGSSESSFNSGKLIDGYRDFLLDLQKQQLKHAKQQSAEQLKEKGHDQLENFQKKQKKSKDNKDQNQQKFVDDFEQKGKKTSTSCESSISLSALIEKATGKLTKNGVNTQDDPAEFDLNISFSGGYVPNTDLSRVDKGLGNPQFKGLDAN